MPVITFEKISPPRGPVAPIARKSRGLMAQILDRFTVARLKREQKRAARAKPKS